MATLGGFIAGGSGGVGSIRWGGLRNFGNILGLKVITCEAEPRVLDLTGTDILKVAHAYGTNGIIVEVEMPLTAAYDWVDFMAGFDFDHRRRAPSPRQWPVQDGMLLKEIAPVAAPVPYDCFNRHRPYIRHRDQSVVLHDGCAGRGRRRCMDLPRPLEGRDALPQRHSSTKRSAARCRRIYELAWNHTTLRGLKIDPTITYLQTQYPDLEHVKMGHRHCSATRCRCISR